MKASLKLELVALSGAIRDMGEQSHAKHVPSRLCSYCWPLSLPMCCENFFVNKLVAPVRVELL